MVSCEKPLDRLKLIKREINPTSNLSHKQRIGGVRSRILLFYDKFKIGSGHSQPDPVQIMIPCGFQAGIGDGQGLGGKQLGPFKGSKRCPDGDFTVRKNDGFLVSNKIKNNIFCRGNLPQGSHCRNR